LFKFALVIKKLFLLFFSSFIFSQTISPLVLNTCGKSSTLTLSSNPIEYSDNMGEPFISTIGSGTIITQGFLQPEFRLIPYLSSTVSGVTCLDKRNGSINIEVKNMKPGSVVSTSWSPAGSCTANPCLNLDNLSGGTFSVLLTVNDGQTVHTLVQTFTVTDSNEPCIIKVFNGVTLYGNNPFLYIENIEQYPDNNVTILTRWGNKIKSIEGYNNRDRKWPSENDGKPMSGTYYLIIESKKFSKPLKTYIEVVE
jgi:hypothetical protein